MFASYIYAHMSTQKVQMSTDQIQRQVTALEHKVANMIATGAPQKGIFALNGKIKKLKTELQSRKNFDYLAK